MAASVNHHPWSNAPFKLGSCHQTNRLNLLLACKADPALYDIAFAIHQYRKRKAHVVVRRLQPASAQCHREIESIFIEKSASIVYVYVFIEGYELEFGIRNAGSQRIEMPALDSL